MSVKLLLLLGLMALILFVALMLLLDTSAEREKALKKRLAAVTGRQETSSQAIGQLLIQQQQAAGLNGFIRIHRERLQLLGGRPVVLKIAGISALGVVVLFVLIKKLALSLAAPILLPVFVALCWAQYQWLEKRYRAEFTEHLVQAVELIARAAKAGNAVPAALQQVGEQVPNPTGQEFTRISQQLRIGVPLEQTLGESVARMPVMQYAFFSVTLLLNQDKGGRLAHVMETLAATLRGQKTTLQKVKTMTSEPRMSALILGIIPIVMFGVMKLVHPANVDFLMEDPTGRKILLYIVISVLTGFLVLHRLTRVDI
ncbi:Uncharacterised protein [BD1-7 clade bacterium]|uniref:Type II secretion system protein GspF domain-containing protein n=1 Tax=BD1-7 clade bacterium TaxID=2029982 RepID=A0A5S9N6R9_9GAMM|nr:Uncharacterised protein [BD1-7 clade bacterium]